MDSLELNKSTYLPGQLAINSLSWHEFIDEILMYREHLTSCKSGVVLINLSNTVSGLALIFASYSLNLTAIIASSYYTEDFLQNIIDAYHVNYYISLEEGRFISQVKYQDSVYLTNQPKLCLLSSGTTGIPKCVEHTWETLIARIQFHEKYKKCTWFCGYPITHFAGIQVVLQCLYNGGHLVLPENYQVGSMFHALESYNPEYLNCTPTLIRQLFLSHNDFDWRSCGLRRITLGGEIVDQELIDLIKQKMLKVGVTHIYASTELGTLITVNDEQAGFPLSLIDEQCFTIKNETLWVKPSQSAMLGYFDKPQLSKTEWVNTKDMVVVKGSRVFFVGREDDLINIGGYKVNPTLVEQVILQLPGVCAVSVYGKKNPIMGHILKANIVLDNREKHTLPKKEIIQYCKAHLPDYMVPRMIDYVDELTLTATYKVLRREG